MVIRLQRGQSQSTRSRRAGAVVTSLYDELSHRYRRPARAREAAHPVHKGPGGGDGTRRPKQPNQYTARHQERANAAAASADAEANAPTPSPNPDAYFLGVSRLNDEWTSQLVRSGSEELLGTYRAAKAAAEAAAKIHMLLVRGGGRMPAVHDVRGHAHVTHRALRCRQRPHRRRPPRSH